MESRIRNFLLNTVVSLIFLTPALVYGAELEDKQELESVIQPEIERSKFDESKIKSTDFEVIGSLGVISIEDFGTNPVLLLKLNYHVSDDFFVGAEWARADGEETSFEVLSGGAPLFTDKEREMTTYLLTLGYNLFPGEAFLTDNVTYNTSFYVIGGMGNTVFGDDDHFTVSVGAGYRVLVSNFLAVYTDFRDNIFNTDIFGEDKTTHNLLFTVGAGFYF
jgi:outer membrane beta-barrel protein